MGAIRIGKLPKEMDIDFWSLWDIRPGEARSKVMVYDRQSKSHVEKTIFRTYMSYMRTPEFDGDVEKSYMFVNKSDSVPPILEPFVRFAKGIDPRYNQMVVNWYNSSDHIELHRDCTSGMISGDSPILTVNLNETDNIYSARSFIMVDVETGEASSILLLDKTYFVINNNQTHRHAVGYGTEKRISLTFRMMK